MASLIIDGVLVVLSIFLIINYTRKGFVKTILDVAKTILSIILAFCLRNSVGRIIDSWFMNAKVTSWVRNSLYSTFNGDNNFVDFVSVYDDVPSFYRNILTKFGLDMQSFEEEISIFRDGGEDVINSLAENIGSALSMMFSVILAVLAVFTISIIVLSIVVHLLNLFTKLAAINFINRLLGFAFGAVMAVLIMWITSVAVNLLIQYIGPLKPDVFNNSLIENSVILKFFSENNFFQSIINRLKK